MELALRALTSPGAEVVGLVFTIATSGAKRRRHRSCETEGRFVPRTSSENRQEIPEIEKETVVMLREVVG